MSLVGKNDNLIEIRNLRFKFGDRWIFNDVNIDIPRGKITAFMGPSGTGKTTLLRLISGQLYPESGSIKLNGKNIPELNRTDLFSVRREMGMLFQNGALFTDLSVYENVAFPLRVNTKLPEAMIRDLVLMKLQAVGLRGARDLMPNELSGGMARRAALARAIVLDPTLIMYDEPFAGQDPISKGVLIQLIRRLNKSLELTNIIVSHDVQETASIADYIYVLADGIIIGRGTPEEILNSDEPQMHQFIRGSAEGPVEFHYPADDYFKDLGLEKNNSSMREIEQC